MGGSKEVGTQCNGSSNMNARGHNRESELERGKAAAKTAGGRMGVSSPIQDARVADLAISYLRKENVGEEKRGGGMTGVKPTGNLGGRGVLGSPWGKPLLDRMMKEALTH